MALMLKTEAIQLLGGTATAAADAVGVTPQAVSGWPDELPKRIEDRVLAALWRQQQAARAAANRSSAKTSKPAA